MLEQCCSSGVCTFIAITVPVADGTGPLAH